jgi:hypothetical protein
MKSEISNTFLRSVSVASSSNSVDIDILQLHYFCISAAFILHFS